MTEAAGKLSQTDHDRIFRDQVLEESGFLRTTPQRSPKAIILAGQPGSGKGSVAASARIELNGNVVIVDPDDLRKFHPDIELFQESHPYTWSTFTHPDASSWAAELRQSVIDSRRNLVIDTTLGHDGWAIKTIDSLRRAGYDVEIRAIAAHRLESENGVDSRFSQSLDTKGFGRYVPEQVRSDVYKKLPANLDAVSEATGVPIKIFQRDGTLRWDSSVDAGRPGEALERVRESRISSLTQSRHISNAWERQVEWHRDLPGRIVENTRVSANGATNVLFERTQLGVVEGVAANALEARANVVYTHRAFAGRALGAATVAAVTYDAFATQAEASHLASTGNSIGAQSSILHFGVRNVGMLAGAQLGAATGAALGVESGPGLLVTGTVGGVAGAIGGDKFANKIDDYRTYNQQDRSGHSWHMDPDRPELGWTRTETRIDPTGPAMPGHGFSAPAYKTQTITAPPEIANELNYKASGVQVQLALAHPPAPRDPYSIKAEPTDTPSLREANWERDAGTHAWSRSVTTGYMEHGLPVTRTELASPDRTRELERASSQLAEENRANRPEAIAEKYRDAYLRYGWSHFGDPEEAAMKALHAPKDVRQASDGNEYKRAPDGAWKHEGWFGHESRATGNLRDELNEAARSNGIHAPPTKQDAPSSPTHDRINEMLEAARNGDWNRFRQETQAFADMPPGQQLQQNAVQQANQIEQHAEQQRAAQLQQQQNEQQQTQQQAHGPRMVR